MIIILKTVNYKNPNLLPNYNKPKQIMNLKLEVKLRDLIFKIKN
jgi:hypothetical protein